MTDSNAADRAEVVLLEADGPIATITINRPDKLNALDASVLSGLHDAIGQLRAWEDVRCAILTGAGQGLRRRGRHRQMRR